MTQKIKLLTPMVAASVMISMNSHAALIFHSSMDNVDAGAFAGADSTANGPFGVGNSVGPDGTAGGGANIAPIATTTGDVVSGATGQIGEALIFPGSENAGVRYEGVANPGTGGYSVSLWFNFNGSAQNGILAGMGNAGSASEGWTIFHENGRLIFRMSVDGGGNDLRAAVNTTIGNDSAWHHATLVIDPAVGEIFGYLDGIAATGVGLGGPPDGSYVTDVNGVANGDPLLLGVRSTGGFQFLGGLDDVGIWNEALDATAVSQIYQNGLNGISSSVPEPSAFLMSFLGLSVLLRRRR
ncbi:LamG-like jellyroll fold domain-containing protein [Verrucomicrobiaceae bacterium 227]